MTIAIHQPNFVPWYPYFQKIQECDTFVIMSHCQYEKGGYQNRFNVGGKFYGIPVSKGVDTIFHKTYNKPSDNWNKITNQFTKLKVFDSCMHLFVWRMNSGIIERACEILNIKTPIERDYPTELKGTERLVDICKTHGATKYLSGISGLKYLDIKLFEQAGIEVIFQDESKMDKRPLIEFI